MSDAREPSFAGSFYPGDMQSLNTMIDGFFRRAKSEKIRNIRGLIVPHAGYIYSGKIAASGYRNLLESGEAARPIILLGPNHRGFPYDPVTDSALEWKFPNGNLSLNRSLIASVDKENVKTDHYAHALEHSLEVQGPIIVRKVPNFGILPIIIGDQSFSSILRLYKDLSEILPDTVIIATSDLSHYIPEKTARKIDEKIISSIETLDIKALYSLVDSGATPCGYGPAAFLMLYSAENGFKLEHVSYGTSADTTGDSESVVGYTAIVCHG